MRDFFCCHFKLDSIQCISECEFGAGLVPVPLCQDAQEPLAEF